MRRVNKNAICPPMFGTLTRGISFTCGRRRFLVLVFCMAFIEPPALLFFWFQRGRLYMAFTIPRGKHFQQLVGVLERGGGYV